MPESSGLAFDAWCKVVNVAIVERLPDVSVAGTQRSVKWKRGSLCVTVQPNGEIWWVHFERNGGFAMPPLCVARHDRATARNVAKTIMGFFDATLSVPDVPNDERLI